MPTKSAQDIYDLMHAYEMHKKLYSNICNMVKQMHDDAAALKKNANYSMQLTLTDHATIDANLTKYGV